MRMRWAIAAVGALALALLTVSTCRCQWPVRRRGSRRRRRRRPVRADAKPANLELHDEGHERQGRHASPITRARSSCSISGRRGAAPARSRFRGSSSSRRSTEARPAGDRRLGRRHASTSSKPYVAQFKMNYPVLQGLEPRRRAGRVRADVGHSGHRADLARRKDLREAHGPELEASRSRTKSSRCCNAASPPCRRRDMIRSDVERIHARAARLRLPHHLS